ncbi:MAG: hypothetical protein M1832_001329 [Thelocarpon impressellum]|nr:MAG: hypothetical protein M1832_001329 [Thelocarpon impressellum]
MDRRGHDQPDLDVAYTTPGNPVSKAPDEQRAAEATHASAGPPSARRTPHDEASATPQPSALGAGARDAHARDAHTDEREPAGGGVDPLDGEQMRAPGEGDVMAAQWHKTGFGEQESLTASLEEKISDQKGRREEVKGERARGVDVGGVLGQSGGPATVEGR